jgi:RNA polymerase sigma-70 factor (ECF subfamily)
MNWEQQQMVDMAGKNRFLEQIEQNQDIVHKICGLYAANTDDRKDLSQKIICQLWKSYQSFRGDSKFTTWMYKVALNTALLNLRRHRSKIRTESLKEHHADIADEAAGKDKYGQISRLYKAISQLGKLDRAIILLYLEQFSYKEISEVIGISESNVSVRLVRIKKKLKELLSGGI